MAEPADPANAARPGLFQLSPTDLRPAASPEPICRPCCGVMPNARPSHVCAGEPALGGGALGPGEGGASDVGSPGGGAPGPGGGMPGPAPGGRGCGMGMGGVGDPDADG